MTRRERTPPDTTEFRDPLSDYSPPLYTDPLERSLCEDTVAAIEHQPFRQVGPETTVAQALSLMAEHDVACLVVTQSGKPIGVFSERDVLNRVAEDYAMRAEEPVRSVMTPKPIVVYNTESPARVLNLMCDGVFRHVPVVDADGKLVGVIGARRVTAYLQRYFEDL